MAADLSWLRRKKRRANFLGVFAVALLLAEVASGSDAEDARLADRERIPAFSGPGVSVFVELDDGTTMEKSLAARARVRQLARAVRAHVRYEYTLLPNVMNLRRVPEEAIRDIAVLPGVARVFRDEIVSAQLYDSVPLIRGMESQLSDAGLSVTGAGIRVCVIDTGVLSTHQFFGGGRVDVAAGWDFVNDDPDATDDSGHGTHVAGIAAGGPPVTQFQCQQSHLAHGVAPEAIVIPVKVLSPSGFGSQSDIIAGIDHCAFPGLPGGPADIINLSLGHGEFAGACDGDIVAQAANGAVAADVAVVASSGNSGDISRMKSPACGSQVIAVGATYDRDYPNCQYSQTTTYTWCTQTSGGACVEECSDEFPRVDQRVCMSNGGDELDVMAPGCRLFSSWGSGPSHFGSVCGTSMAAPHVAGLAALILELAPWYTPLQVREAIRRGAIDRGPPGFDPAYGYGRIDVINSLSLIQGPNCTTHEECDDGSICSGSETCDVVLGCRFGTPLDCSDGITCTIDGCDTDSGCEHVAVDSACDDADPCSGVETCGGGGCEAGFPLADGTSCSDGLVCNGAETCTGGACTAGTALPDADGDGACDLIDVCPGVADPAQVDDDADTFGNACDCAPENAAAWHPPGEPRSLRLFHRNHPVHETTLVWEAPGSPGGTDMTYDVLRSVSASGFADPGLTACIETGDGSDAQAIDGTILEPGEVAYFLVVASNACGPSEAEVRDCP